MVELRMLKNLQNFVQDHFFMLKQVSVLQDTTPQEYTRLGEAFTALGFKDSWVEHLSEMETLVGTPIAAWHAGHLARMKGQELPHWEKHQVYVNGFGTSQRLEELERNAADTLAKMKFALVRDALKHYAQLHDQDVQTKMNALITEMHERSLKNPMVFLEHLANRRFAKTVFGITTKPTSQWSKTDKTTELVCQLANLTFLDIQNALQSNNSHEQTNSPIDPMATISVR